MAYTRRQTQDGVTVMNKDLYDNLQDGIEEHGITPQMFGAIGDGIHDDTEALQKCINYSLENNIFIVATKTYLVTSSLILNKRGLTLYGFKNGRIMFKHNEGNPSLFTETDEIQDGDFTVQFIGMNFERIGGTSNNEYSIFMDCYLKNSVIRDCRIYLFEIIFSKQIGNTSKITHNVFYSVMRYFCTNSVIDSDITDNYISGYQPLNPTCFYCEDRTYTISTSRICRNFFDFFKFGFDICIHSSLVSENIFDYLHTPIYLNDDKNLVSSLIVNNKFIHTDVSISSGKYTSPDEFMISVEPRDIRNGRMNPDYSMGFTYYQPAGSLIIGNIFSAGVEMKVPYCGFKIEGNKNLFFNKGSILLGTDTTKQYEPCFIEDLENTNIDSLEIINLAFGRQNIYEGTTRRYKNKMVTLIKVNPENDSFHTQCKWVDSLGNIVTE